MCNLQRGRRDAQNEYRFTELGRALAVRFREAGRVMLSMTDVSKKFGGVRALTDISFDVSAGEVVGLVGDNGAGKSTLLKILSGVIAPTSGNIFVDGEEKVFASPRQAMEAGLATVYQDLALASYRNVVENFFLGRELLTKNPFGRFFGIQDRKLMEQRTQEALAALRTRLPDIHRLTRDLSGGQRQILAISRAASWSEKVLLLDEPTSALGVEQQREVLELIKRVRDNGTAVILVSHQMPDVIAVCDRAIVLRLGRVARALSQEELTYENLVGYITGALNDDQLGDR